MSKIEGVIIKNLKILMKRIDNAYVESDDEILKNLERYISLLLTADN